MQPGGLWRKACSVSLCLLYLIEKSAVARWAIAPVKGATEGAGATLCTSAGPWLLWLGAQHGVLTATPC